jgi:hypothetical protein
MMKIEADTVIILCYLMVDITVFYILNMIQNTGWKSSNRVYAN